MGQYKIKSPGFKIKNNTNSHSLPFEQNLKNDKYSMNATRN